MGHRIIRALWGDLRGDELKKFALLATGFFFLIGSYWPLKTLKDSIFANVVGPIHLPTAKMLSLALFFPLVLAYSKLVDHFSKEKMVYMLISFYGIVGFVLVYFLYHPTIGLPNPQMGANRLIGWVFFLYVESFISLMISLYWSFVNDITTPESAKKGYGLIIFGTQLGGFLLTLLGNLLSKNTDEFASRAPLIAMISICMFFAVGFITFLLQHIVQKDTLKGYQQKDHSLEETKSPKKELGKGVGFLDGLKVLVTHPYVAGIFGTIFFHELISTVMNYQMILLAKSTYVSPGLVNKFLFDYALCVQGIACLFGLFGTSFFQRRFGIKFCIVAYPLLLGTFILSYLLNPTLSNIFYVMLIAKAINYAFNQPAKEVLYIPTSRSIKYKSKAWVDMFGMRFSKASGSLINKAFGSMISITGSVVLCFIILWAFLSSHVGNVFRKAIKNNELIE